MMRDEFEIDGRIIGPSHPTYIVAELSANHGHDFPRAKAMVEAAPKTIKEGASKDEAEALKKAIEDVGGKVTLK